MQSLLQKFLCRWTWIVSIVILGLSSPARSTEVWPIVRASDLDNAAVDYLPNLLGKSEVSGVVFYTSLSRVQPQEGVFDWAGVTSVVNACQTAGKPMKLAILGGRWVPQWIYTKGAASYTWTLSSTYVDPGQSQATAPVPWDSIYLDAMEAAARAAGAQFSNHPTLKEVQVTGPALSNGLETNLIMTATQAAQIGYTQDKLIDAWKRMITVYATAFPTKRICLALHDDIAGQRTATVARTLRDYAYSLYFERFSPQACYVTHDSWFHYGNQAVDIWGEKNAFMDLSGQLINIYSTGGGTYTTANFDVAIRNAVLLGAVRLEIFAADLNSTAYEAQLLTTLQSLAQRRCWYEAEALTVSNASPVPFYEITDPLLSGGIGDKLDCDAVGQFLSYSVPFPSVGTYRVIVRSRRGSDQGQASLAINGTTVGSAQDQYAATPGVVDFYYGGLTQGVAANADFLFTVTGKNAASSSYRLCFDQIRLAPFQDCENLPYTPSAGRTADVITEANNFNGGKGIKLNSTTVGDAITFRMRVPKAGVYSVAVKTKYQSTRGICQLTVDGVNVGTPWDQYSATDSYAEKTIGTVTITESTTKKFVFTVTGKNASSLGYSLLLDYIKLTPTQP